MHEETNPLQSQLNTVILLATANPMVEGFNVDVAINNFREVFKKLKLKLGTIEIRRQVAMGRDMYCLHLHNLILGEALTNTPTSSGAAFPPPDGVDHLTTVTVECTCLIEANAAPVDTFDIFIPSSRLRVLYMSEGYGGELHRWASGTVTDKILTGKIPERITDVHDETWDCYTEDVSDWDSLSTKQLGLTLSLIRTSPYLWGGLTDYYATSNMPRTIH